MAERLAVNEEVRGSKPRRGAIHITQLNATIMKRSNIQRRQAAERERLEIYEATLRRATRQPRPVPDFARAIEEAERAVEALGIRR